MKKILLAVALVGISLSPAFADFKYTEETKTEMQMPSMMGAFMQNAMQNSTVIKTVSVKGTSERVDFNRKNISIITKCDKGVIIALDHNKKIYNQKTFDQELSESRSACKAIAAEAKKAPQVPVKQNIPNKPLTFKTVITDTKQDEMVGNLKARKYIREMFISGNPACMPNMHTKEYIWTVNLQAQEFTCPVFAPLKECMKLPQIKEASCLKNAKYVKVGLADVPGFIVKSQIIMDMSEMAKGNFGTETGRAAGIFDSVMNVLDRTVDTVNKFSGGEEATQDYHQQNNYQNQNYNYPPQQYNNQNYPQQQGNYPQGIYQQSIPQQEPNFENGQMPEMKSITTMTRTNISFAVLPASLFEVPAGYKLVPGFKPDEFGINP